MQRDGDNERVTLDENSFDFRGLGPTALEEHLHHLNETMERIRDGGTTIRIHPWWTDVACLDECSLIDFVYARGQGWVSRDTLLLFAIELDRCVSWDEDEAAAVESVVVQPVAKKGETYPSSVLSFDCSLSLGIALARAKQQMMACLVFPGTTRRGLYVHVEDDARHVYFFSDEDRLCEFWRLLFSMERVPERDFLTLAPYAFPRLAFHPDLDFRKFDGQYRELRDRVVKALCVLNDHFAEAHARHAGVSHGVNSELGGHGIEVSMESPGTRGSKTLMSHRMVAWENGTVRCEWHAKLEPHRNRIHFSEPLPDGRILIGIFADHLPTK